MGAYDLVVLDIFMGKMTGIEVAEKLRETDKSVHIAFGTSSNEFASESYDLNACYYLCKPFQADKVKPCLTVSVLMKLIVCVPLSFPTVRT